ncbi:hypothetical protein Nepgr_007686 [Nepenthes gracilis]|uniref:peptidylprolyl isomerase n=1 Tax=Nepenthes gracilis TaxID=150966 RepID=A0AAD3S7P7_NEPGR|nr:hypothetical protein Nepgr_007686 [Nepenthes gracilis]
MAATFLRCLTSLPQTSTFSRICSEYNKWTTHIVTKNNRSGFSSFLARSLQRRSLLYMGFVPILSYPSPFLAAPIPEMEESEIIRTRKLPGGIRVQDIIEGDGQEAIEGDLVEFNYVCRRSNGYFVYSTVDQFTGEAMPAALLLDEKQIIKGLKDVLVGMKVGGKRRALIPPSVGYVNENLKPMPEEFGPRPFENIMSP